MIMKRPLRAISVVIAGVLVGGIAGTVGVRAGQALAPESRTPSTAQLAAEYDASIVAITGHLRRDALAAVAGRAGEDSLALLVIVRGRDLAGCEDLGRQLREVRHRAPTGTKLVVWTLARDQADVERFVRRERIRATVSASPSLDALGLRPVPLVTPAVVRVRLPDGGSQGIGHTNRFKNVRSRSFADELPRMLEDRPGGRVHPPLQQEALR